MEHDRSEIARIDEIIKAIKYWNWCKLIEMQRKNTGLPLSHTRLPPVNSTNSQPRIKIRVTQPRDADCDKLPKITSSYKL